jgi:hypothetical protein
MKSVGDFLLDDARSALLRTANTVRERKGVMAAAVCWLLSDESAIADIEAMSDAAEGCRGGMRTYREVAILGLACAVLPKPFKHQDALEAGLQWLTGLPSTSAGSAYGFATDPVAMLGIALGLRHSPESLLLSGREWMARFVADSYRAQDLNDEAQTLWSVVGTTAGVDRQLPLPMSPELADVRITMRSKGLIPDVFATQGEEDEKQLLQLMKQPAEPHLVPFRAAVRVAAFDWVRRALPTIIPARMTPPDVVTLLKQIEFALKRWTWEDNPKTSTCTAQKWNLENEYHLQNLLWFLLAPIFSDLTDEEYTVQLGSKNPRLDIGIPSLQLIVEAKFMRAADPPKKFIEEIATDTGLYLVEGSRYKQIVAVIWDNAGRTHLHDGMSRAIKQIEGIFDVVVLSRPSTWT